MHEVCLVCLQRDEHVRERYHKRCLKELFGKPVLPELEVERANLHLIGLEMAGRVSLSGVQEKISLGLDARMNLRMLGPSGRYILKPEPGSYPELPANEQLCMRIARLMGLEVARTGLMEISDGSLALIVKRFDRADDGSKLPMEDFCQLAQKLPREKYTGSAELTAKLVAEHSSQPPLDGLALWRAWLVSWLLGNGDLHLKNLALLGASGSQQLAPLYDLVSTSLVLPNDTLAMPIAGKKENLKPAQWMDLAERCQLVPETVTLEVRRMLLAGGRAMALLHNVPLRDDFRLRFAQHLATRLEELKVLHSHADDLSKRRLRQQRAATEPTAAAVAKTHMRLHAALVALGFPEDDLRLQDRLKEMTWLSCGTGSLFREGGPWTEDRPRAEQALLEWLRLEPLSHMLLRGPQIPGAKKVLNHLRQSEITGGTHVEEQPGNRLFELEVAAALAFSVPGQITLDAEPHDILFLQDGDPHIALECKRPLHAESLVKNLRYAVEKQLARHCGPGYVVISLDRFQPTKNWLQATDYATAREAARRDMDEVLNPELRRKMLEVLPDVETGSEDIPHKAMGALVLKTYGTMTKAGDDKTRMRLHVEVRSVAHEGLPKQMIEFTFVPFLRAGMEKAFGG